MKKSTGPLKLLLRCWFFVFLLFFFLQVLACAPSNIAVDNMVEKLVRAKAKVGGILKLCPSVYKSPKIQTKNRMRDKHLKSSFVPGSLSVGIVISK